MRFRVSYDFIAPSEREFSATIRPGQRFTIGPDAFLDAFFEYVKAIQPDSRLNEYYIARDDGPPLPDLQFYVGAFRLTLKPYEYLSEVC